MKANGTIDKYKAKLVIKGFRKCEGLNYFYTYLPVTRITSIRMILAIATLRNPEVHQMDVKMAFLNDDLEEEIYMNQPEGCIAPGQEGQETRGSSRLDDEAIQDKRQRDENDIQVERQDQVEEVIEPRRGKRARTKKSFRP
nr:zinc finger CCCH domain-containing protein 14 [Tanacetum cinerariifolium]